MFRVEDVYSVDMGVSMREVFLSVPKTIEEDFMNARKILSYVNGKEGVYTFNVFPLTILKFYRDFWDIYPKTEGVYMEIVGSSYDRVDVLKLIDAVEYVECGVVIDDFGLDSASFVVASVLPRVVCVKFDGGYWKDSNNSLSVEGYVSGFKSEGIKVVAEQVETEGDFRRAVDLGFDSFQGFYFLRERFLKWRGS